VAAHPAFDAIVVGLGAMGSATMAELSARGLRVLGLEAFGPGHANGSSHGRSRIIRYAYAEGATYVPLVLRAGELWRALEAASGRRLLTVTGGVFAGPPGSWVLEGTAASAASWGLAHERLSAAQVNARWPAFALPAGLDAVVEAGAGFLDPAACLAALVERAEAAGAEARWREPVTGWAAGPGAVTVGTAAGDYEAAALVVTAGPWAGRLLAGLGLPLEVLRVVTADLAGPGQGGPVFLLELPEGELYGVPEAPGRVKVGRHDAGSPTDPDTVDRVVAPAEAEALASLAARYLPGLAGPVSAATTCMYTMTPDRDFVLGTHPAHANVAFAAGFSGHGFKFATAIGEALAELVTEGRTSQPTGFLAPARFAGPQGPIVPR
jgi:sarcosine oxidase